MKTLYLFLLINLCASVAFGVDGEPDANFGSGGRVLTASTTSDYLERIAQQPDGKIIAAGYSSPSRTSFTFSCLIVRYNPDGTTDSSFGVGGRFVFSPNAGSCQLFDARVQTDGKIIAAGLHLNKIAVFRLNPNGTLDTSFNGTGYHNSTTGFANSLEVEAATGKILVGGSIVTTAGGFRYNFALLRFNSNGTLDPAFDGDGVVTTAIGTPGLTNAEGIADFKITAQGKYVGVGTTENATTNQNLTIVRYNNDGSLDASLGGTGYVVKTIAGDISNGQAIDVQPDGKIVTAGSSNPGSRTLARFNSDGSMDATFGAGGFAFTPAGGDEFHELIVQTDGKILTAGRKLQAIATGHDFYLVRLNGDGTPDASFGAGGVVFTNFSAGNTDQARSVLLQTDGKILVGGISYAPGSAANPYIFALARYQNAAAQPPVDNPALRVADFDGDARTDVSVYRGGTWYISPSASNFAPESFYGVPFGLAADRMAPADYDGDGRTDLAVWRENAAGDQAYFYILQSSDGVVRVEPFGLTGDQLTVGDWDGDGRSDPAVYRAGAQGVFYYRGSFDNPSGATTYLPWGTSGDRVARGDFDGDRQLDAAVFRPSNATWYIRQSADGQVLYRQFGLATDKLIAGDFDGDGRTDPAVYRDGTWYILQSSNGQIVYRFWGLSSDVLAAGDYDGDGRTDPAVWRDGVFYILGSSNAQVVYRNFGATGDAPVAAAFVR